MDKELAKTLATALVQFIDKERPEGTTDCSNVECESIEQMLEGEHFDIVEAFIQKKLSGLTEFEQALSNYLKNDFEYFSTKEWDGQKWNDVIICQSKELLAIAKKELFKLWNENMKDEYARGKRDGVTIGYNKAMKEYNESVTYHYDTRPLCWEPGGTCTNPHMDCINCPRKTTGGFNTSSGISTFKVDE